jgi:hypothetical protein
MTEIKKFESGGYFGVQIDSGGSFGAIDLDGGSLGTGQGMNITRFLTEEGREYYIQWFKTNEILGQSMIRTRMFQDELADIRTVRGAWRNLKQALYNWIRNWIRKGSI